MPDSKQVIVHKLDAVLTGFLKAYAIKKLDKLQIEKRINRLHDITFGGKSRYRLMEKRFEALETWFDENHDLLTARAVDDSMKNRISECVDQIGAFSRGDYDNFNMKSGLYNRKQAARIALIANKFISGEFTGRIAENTETISVKYIKPPEIKTGDDSLSESRRRDINDRLKDSIDYQTKMLEYFRKSGQHPFTAVDNLLKSIDNNPDIKTRHMVASVLYFLKLNGYKVAPYVERLRKLDRNENE